MLRSNDVGREMASSIDEGSAKFFREMIFHDTLTLVLRRGRGRSARVRGDCQPRGRARRRAVRPLVGRPCPRAAGRYLKVCARGPAACTKASSRSRSCDIAAGALKDLNAAFTGDSLGEAIAGARAISRYPGIDREALGFRARPSPLRSACATGDDRGLTSRQADLIVAGDLASATLIIRLGKPLWLIGGQRVHHAFLARSTSRSLSAAADHHPQPARGCIKQGELQSDVRNFQARAGAAARPKISRSQLLDRP